MLFALKLVLSAVIIAGASELAKRSTTAGALLISLPLSSMLALTWLYVETKDAPRVAAMSSGIFWAVFPSLLFLFTLPALLKRGWGYWSAMAASSCVMAVGYAGYTAVLRALRVSI